MHTPGPWIFAETKPDDARGVIGPNNLLLFGKPFEGTAPDADTEGRANCALIAAAPEMLEALERLADGGFSFVSWVDVDQLCALIAKAKGGAA